jgi:uncharacterized LabA/DUF88 family protein
MTSKTVLFIDGPNLYATAKVLGFDIDYKKVLQEFRSQEVLLRANYYTTVDDQASTPIMPLIDWLDYNGYSVVTKPTKTFTDANGRRKNKANMDVEIAVDVMELVPHVAHIVLFSGDGNFRALVEAVQRRGVKVTVVSSVATEPAMCADELRRQADDFIDVIDLKAKIARVHGVMPAREAVRHEAARS